ncbi:MAG: prepilin-type N-terminal cleavage/methylation domain-containing protein [Candidatus Ozemobacteraceae bacterium]
MKRNGFSMVELLFVLLLFGLVSGGIYRFLFQYSRGYLKVTDKMENVAEGWQILRLLNDDLTCSEIPDTEKDTLEKDDLITDGEFVIQRRREKNISKVIYRIEKSTGNVSREEDAHKIRFLHARCKEFKIGRYLKPFGKTGNQKNVFYRVKLDIGDFKENRDSAKSVSIETCIFPIFLNLQLRKRYVHEGFPE